MQFPFRVTDDRKGFYFVEFDYAWQTINVTLREPGIHGVTKLSVVNYVLEKGLRVPPHHIGPAPFADHLYRR